MGDKARCIGITGGIGSGKTTVCRIFRVYGVPVYHADDRARDLMVEDGELVAAIQSVFGPEAYLDDGTLNRRYLGSTVFPDQSKLERLNALVHPRVAADFDRWLRRPVQKSAVYTIKEAALLFETGSYRQLEATVAVLAPDSVKTERVLLRDPHRDAAQVREILKRQMHEQEREAMADHVIINDGRRALIPQVHALHDLFSG